MSRRISIILLSTILFSCSFSGFKPPATVDSWDFPGSEKYLMQSNPNGLYEYFDKKEKDMRACGIDPVVGDSNSAKSGLCMESKGWYEKKGPVCEDPMFYDDPLCVKWRAKHKR